MVAYGLLLLAAVLVSAAVLASLPWRNERHRAYALGLQLAVSAIIPVIASTIFITWQAWAIALAPGSLIALIRLVLTLRSMSANSR